MRTAFIDTLFALAVNDPRILLIVGDIGYGVVERFQRELPRQFVNAGVAEQNMTSMAAGMALNGRVVVTYSIGNFPVMRCLEQIRNDVCHHNANVKIVSVGGGFAYGALGASHHAIEDVAITRVLPNLVVLAPNDDYETTQATRAMLRLCSPCYMRIGRSGGTVATIGDSFTLGRARCVERGSDVSVVVAGGLLSNVLEATRLLAKDGLSADVLSVHTIKPLDVDGVLRSAAKTGAVITVEEHSVCGGLGSAVAEALIESPARPRAFKRLGIEDGFRAPVGDQAYLRHACGLDPRGLAQSIARFVEDSVTASLRKV